MNHKNARIKKLIARGLSIEKIIKTLGCKDTPEIRERIEKVKQS